jgi:hypothetical protein
MILLVPLYQRLSAFHSFSPQPHWLSHSKFNTFCGFHGEVTKNVLILPNGGGGKNSY